MSKPYTIVCPPYDPVSGGIKVMWALYGYLLSKGVEVYMNERPGRPVIAIYPEIVNGNPANAETVVRYILNKPGVMSANGVPGPMEFDSTDKLYVFSELFNTVGADEKHHMFLPAISLYEFYDQGKKRDKHAVFMGKGEDRGLHPRGAVIVDRELAHDQKELADLLNECTVLYSYDPVSAMTEVARLCGCRVVLLQDIYSKDDYRRYEAGINGISFGMNEEVPLDTEGFRKHYMELRRVFSNKLDDFIKDTQK